jgi:VanZ family protein
LYSYLKKNRIKFLLIPLILYWIALFIGTTLPSDHLNTILELSDKLKHFFAYLVLGTLLSLNLHFQEKWKAVSSFYLVFAFIICIFYGMVDELHQILVPNRSAEFLDWIADLLGSFFGVVISHLFLKIITRKEARIETN